jgi:hypothetical protein
MSEKQIEPCGENAEPKSVLRVGWIQYELKRVADLKRFNVVQPVQNGPSAFYGHCVSLFGQHSYLNQATLVSITRFLLEDFLTV